jgi:hypothetical protein
MSHTLDLNGILNGEAVRKPINDLCQQLRREGSIRLITEFSGGFTKTRVFLAEERASPKDPEPFRLVFKTGSGRLLGDEVRRFQAFIPYARAHAAFAKVVEPDRPLQILPRDDSPGAIAYEYAPAPLANAGCSSLTSVVSECLKGERPVEEVKQIIATTMSALGSLYATPKTDFAYRVARYYLERWVPDFVVTVERAVRLSGSTLLTLNRLDPQHFLAEASSDEVSLRRAAESPSQSVPPDVKMRRLLVAHRDDHRVYLHAPNADDLCLEVGIDALSQSEKKALAKESHVSLWAPAGVSRYEFYGQRLRKAFPDIDTGIATFSFGPNSLHNPLLHLSRPRLNLPRDTLRPASLQPTEIFPLVTCLASAQLL